ncbi:MAG: radical SAM protein [Candidatus Omnitrophica bacterium]|nr:radical SAM protein [Candidatus Omnitrophota bacterium]
MVNFTKLLGGKPTVSVALEAVSKKRKSPLFISCNASSPLVVFNLTRRCNLACRHCYLESKNINYKNELSTPKIKKVIDSLAKIDIPVLLFSGGEPLVHKDILALIEYAKEKKIRVGLSTNGTLITKVLAKRLAKAGIDYVGVSIDGAKSLHDKFRKMKGAYDRAIKGIINAQEAGLKTGVRFTISKANAADLPSVLDLCIKEKIPRFCMYHLVYSGRGKSIANIDIDNKARRKVVDFLVHRALEYNKKKFDFEMLTVDNHADGIYIYNYLKKIKSQIAAQVLELLEFHGGCSAGSKVVDISPTGDVFACQFWQQEAMGNINNTDFSKIWLNKNDKSLCQLRSKSSYLLGKCGVCRYKSYCGGCRIRALVVHNDLWQEDPCCYLTKNEIK